MKLTITIPDDAVADVEEYCRDVLQDNFLYRIQSLANKFVSNALEQMEQRRQIKKDIRNFQKTMWEIFNGE